MNKLQKGILYPNDKKRIIIKRLIAMKLIILFTAILCLNIQANIFSQIIPVKTEMHNASIKDVLTAIEAVSDIRFFYNDGFTGLDKKVNVSLNNNTLDQILQPMLNSAQLTYHQMDEKFVVITPVTISNKFENSMLKQGITITGTITDETGDPVTGVNVVIKGTMNGVVSDLNGKYIIVVPNSDAVLSYSFVGYTSQDMQVAARRVIDIVLQEDTKEIEEVVVIGYGTVRKSDLTGSVASVKSEDLEKMATQSAIAAMQGRAAGVSIVLESGSPDATASIRVRGVGTPNNASPLYVVDGFPMRNIDYLNQADIQSMEILKDASATAIYGSRGANGVVLITTKKGSAGTLKVNVNGYYGIEALAVKPSMLNSKQYATLSNEAYANAGQSPVYSDVNNLKYDTDWLDEVTRTGQIQNYTISLSGGNDKVTSLFSANYFGRNGVIQSTGLERLSFSSNSTMKVASFLSFNSSFAGTFSNIKRLDPSSIFLSSLMAPPDIPVFNDDTDYYTGITKIRLANPAGRIARNHAVNRRSYLVGNFSMNLKLFKDLTFNSRFGVRYDGTYNSDFTPVFYETADNSESVSNVSRSTSRAIEWTWDNILTYQKRFNNIHDLTVMAAMTANEYNIDSYDATKKYVSIESKEFWYFDSASDNTPTVNGSGNSLAMLSYLGRINYNLLDRYLLTASIRADGSSRFVDSNRWGYFPSVAFAWKISEENFFKSMATDWFTIAKLRLGYGEIGNENINSYYPYNTPITQRQYYTLGSTPARLNGALPNGIGNTAAQWETSTQFNVGLDLAFIKGKLSITADYFIRKTDDILLSQSIPILSGFNTMIRNVGGMENKGFELTVGFRDRKGDFNYNVSANMALIKNKATNLGTSTAMTASFNYDYALIDLQGALPNIIRAEVGQPFGYYYGYKTDGIFQNQAAIDDYTKDGGKIQSDAAPGDVKFLDLNNNGRIDTGDMTFIGSPLPDVTYGFSFDASYKKFDFSMLFQGVTGNDIFNAAKYYFMRFDGRQNVRTELLDTYWRGENTSNKQPIVTSNVARNSRNYRASDYYIENGSYLRLKNIQLGYTISPNLAGLKTTMRFYALVQNVFTITKYTGFEAEISAISTSATLSSPVDRGQYPQPRTFILGTMINF